MQEINRKDILNNEYNETYDIIIKRLENKIRTQQKKPQIKKYSIDAHIEKLKEQKQEAEKQKNKIHNKYMYERYLKNKEIIINCPFCKKNTNNADITRHLKGSRCKKLKESLISTHPDGDKIIFKFNLFLNDVNLGIIKNDDE